MPKKKTTKKILKESVKKQQQNKTAKLNIKKLTKDARRAIEAKSLEQAQGLLQKSIKALDKAAQKGMIKKNTAWRKKSRLMKSYNKTVGIENKEKK